MKKPRAAVYAITMAMVGLAGMMGMATAQAATVTANTYLATSTSSDIDVSCKEFEASSTGVVKAPPEWSHVCELRDAVQAIGLDVLSRVDPYS